MRPLFFCRFLPLALVVLRDEFVSALQQGDPREVLEIVRIAVSLMSATRRVYALAATRFFTDGLFAYVRNDCSFSRRQSATTRSSFFDKQSMRFHTRDSTLGLLAPQYYCVMDKPSDCTERQRAQQQRGEGKRGAHECAELGQADDPKVVEQQREDREQEQSCDYPRVKLQRVEPTVRKHLVAMSIPPWQSPSLRSISRSGTK